MSGVSSRAGAVVWLSGVVLEQIAGFVSVLDGAVPDVHEIFIYLFIFNCISVYSCLSEKLLATSFCFLLMMVCPRCTEALASHMHGCVYICLQC